MAQEVKGRRDVVQDPLRQSAQQVLPERSVPIQGVRGPSMPSMAGLGQQRSELESAFGNLQTVFNDMFERQKDDWIAEGKVAYMSGVAEQELLSNGNRYTQMGYLQLKTRNDVNVWYLEQQAALAESSREMSPEQYQQQLAANRKSFLETIEDPYAKKVAIAAFEQFNPDLASKQFVANNDFNMTQRENEAYGFFMTGSLSSPSRSTLSADSPLKLSPQPVGPVMQLSPTDRDIGIKTLIGEAGNQGDTGMAAVAHVIFNRTTDSRFPSSVAGVAKQKNQFSVWNKGKEGRSGYLNSLGPGNPVYDKAAAVFDAVASGRHVDPTGSALYYYSPSGMKSYKEQGIQGHLVPSWASKTEAENLVVIGAHRFSGKSDAAQTAPRAMVEQSDLPPLGSETDKPGIDEPIAQFQARTGVNVSDKLFDGPSNTAGTPAGNSVETMNAAPAEEGVAGISESGAPNEVMDFIQNYKGLPQDRMVSALSKAMATQLDNGEDTLFHDGGGLATLYKMDATPEQISAVTKARERWQNEQDSKFDAEDQAFEDDIMRLAGDGKTSRDEINRRIDAKVKAGAITDSQGRSLSSAAASTIRAEDKRKDEVRDSVFSDTAFLQEIGGLYQQIEAGSIDFSDASSDVQEIAKRYGAKPEDVQQLLGKVFQLDQSRQSKLRTAAAEAARKAEASNMVKAEADRDISRGYGLSDLTGKVTVTGENGQQFRIDGKEYAIQQIKAKAFAKHGDDTNAVALEVFRQLQQHGVTDPQTSAQFQAAVAGNIVGKDGKVNRSAEEAYDLYTMLRENPSMRDDFVSDLVGDPYTRNMLELAYKLDGGNQTGSESLIRAQDIVNGGGDPAARLPETPVVNMAAQQVTKDIIEEELGIAWHERLFGNEANLQSRLWAARDYEGQVTAQLKNSADLYMTQYPWQKPEVALELAKHDVRKKMKLVAGNLVFTDHKLHNRMGLSNPANVDGAVNRYLSQFGKELWPDIDDSWFESKPEEQGYMPGLGSRVRVSYLPNAGESGAFRLSRVVDPETGAIDVGREYIIPLDVIGKHYNSTQSSPTMFERLFDKAGDAVAEGRRVFQAEQERVNRAGELGAAAPNTPSSRIEGAFDQF